MGLVDFTHVSPEEMVRLSNGSRINDALKMKPYYDAFMANCGPGYGTFRHPLFALAMFRAGIATGKRIERARRKVTG